MRSFIIAAVLMTMAITAEAGEADADKNQKIVREGILAFRKAMRSQDEKVRIQAFDATMPDEKLLQKLFGKDAAVLWPLLEKNLQAMRKNTARLKAELDGSGEIKEVKLTDVRKKDVSGRFQAVLTAIPKDMPVYIAVLKYEKGSGGSSSYLVVDGKMRWVGGLEGMHAYLLKRKSSGGDSGPFADLGARFLQAMRSGKIEEARKCWVSVDQLKALMKNPPQGVPKASEDEIKKAAEYFEKRDKVIAAWFPGLLKALKARRVDPKDLTFAKSEGTVRKRGSLEKTSWVKLLFKHKGGMVVKIEVDDGLKLDGKWYFSDKPQNSVTITRHGNEERVEIP